MCHSQQLPLPLQRKLNNMLQVAFIRNNKEEVKQRLAVKNFKQPELIDELIDLDDKRKQIQRQQDEIFAKINSTSKEIGQLMAKGDKEGAERKKQEVAAYKSEIIPGVLETENRIQEILYLIPNLPSEKVPPGKTPADNI